MALFKDVADFATLAPVLATAQWPMLLPSIDMVQRSYLRDQVLGRKLYDHMHVAYQASIATPSVPVPPPLVPLLDLSRKAIAGLAAHRAMPKLGVLFTTGGPMVNQSDTMRPAPQWRTKEAAKALFEEGLGYLDQLIDHLLENDYTWADGSATLKWSDGGFAARIKSCLVRTVQEFNEHHVDVGNSGWLMHRLRPAMLHVQERIRGVLCDAAFDALLAAVQAGNTAEPEKTILRYARPAIIHLAIAQLAVVNSITIDADGAWSVQATSGSNTSTGPVPARDERLNAAIELYNRRGEEYLKKMEAEAKRLAAAGQYPAYANSTCYAVPFVRGSTTPDDSSTFSSI